MSSWSRGRGSYLRNAWRDRAITLWMVDDSTVLPWSKGLCHVAWWLQPLNDSHISQRWELIGQWHFWSSTALIGWEWTMCLDLRVSVRSRFWSQPFGLGLKGGFLPLLQGSLLCRINRRKLCLSSKPVPPSERLISLGWSLFLAFCSSFLLLSSFRVSLGYPWWSHSR